LKRKKIIGQKQHREEREIEILLMIFFLRVLVDEMEMIKD